MTFFGDYFYIDLEDKFLGFDYFLIFPGVEFKIADYYLSIFY